MRPAGKARRPRISEIFEGGATQPAPGSPTRQPRWGGEGMHRPSNAAGLSPRAARPRTMSDADPRTIVERMASLISQRLSRPEYSRGETINRVHHLAGHFLIRREIVASACKRHQLRPGYQRREPSPFLEADGLIVTTVDYQSRRANLHEDLPTIPSGVARFLVAGRGLRIGRDTLHLI